MRKVVAYIAMSLDGYVANVDGSVDWLAGDGSDETNVGSYVDFVETVDTVILGYTTYHQITHELSKDKWPYEGKHTYVLTSKSLEDKKDISFINEDLEKLINELKKSEGSTIWVCGGASVINQFHKSKLIDEYIISIIPTLLGDGIKLFQKNDFSMSLELISTKSYNGIVDLNYRLRK